jgi:hypothetical protein
LDIDTDEDLAQSTAFQNIIFMSGNGADESSSVVH